MVDILFKWAERADRNLGLPAYQTAGAAGADLKANLPDRGAVDLDPGARVLVPLGYAMAIPEGYEVQFRMRSGLALRHGLILPNAPATIDSDYRGDLKVIVMNCGTEPVRIAHGDRIAQMVVAQVVQARLRAVEDLDQTARGAGGFGSTGITG